MELDRKLSSSLELPADMALSPQWKLQPGNKNQFQQGPADPAAKSALIGDWTGAGPTVNSSLFSVGQAASKPAWEAGKAQPKATEAKRVGAAASNVVGGPGRWREDERDGPAARNTDSRWLPGVDESTVKWGVGLQPEVRTPALGGDRWGAAAPVAAVEGLGRGRGRPEDRWGTTREREPWALPGMGEAADATQKRPAERWGNDGAADATKVTTDRWRSPGAHPAVPPAADTSAATGAGRGRGFTVGRGRGIKPAGATPGAPGAPDRWDAPGGRNPGSDGGSIRRYTPQSLDQIRRQAVVALGGTLPMPPPVLHAAVDYPEILPGEPLPEPPSRWQSGLSRAGSMHPDNVAAAEDEGAGRAMVPPQAFALDQWLYKDPQGVIQGPFTKMDILDWLAAGFFPIDLPIKSAMDPDLPFIALSAMVKMWDKIDHGSAPPGFAPGAMPAAAARQQQDQQQQQQMMLQQQQQQQQQLMMQEQQHRQQQAAMAGQDPGLTAFQGPGAQAGGRPSIMELLGKKLQEVPAGGADPNAGFEPAPSPAGAHAPMLQGGGYDAGLLGADGGKGLFGVSPLSGLGGVLGPWGMGVPPAQPGNSFAAWLPPPAVPPPQLLGQGMQHGQGGLLGAQQGLGGQPGQPPQMQGQQGMGVGGSVWDFSPVGAPPARPALGGWGSGQPMQPPEQQHQQQHQQPPLQHQQAQQGQGMAPPQQPPLQQQPQQQHQQQPQGGAYNQPEEDIVMRLARKMGMPLPPPEQVHQIQQQVQREQQQQQQQQQQQVPQQAPPAPWIAAAQASPAVTGQVKSLAEIQAEQAAEAARQAAAQQQHQQQQQEQQQQQHVAAPVQNPNLANMPGPLQQLFGAAQRAAAQPQQQQQQATPSQPEPAAPVETGKKKKSEAKQEAQQQAAAAAAAADAASKPEAKTAPWAAASAKVPAAKTLREIQEEEAARAAAEAQRLAAEQGTAVAAAPAPVAASGAGAASAWAKVAATGAGAGAGAAPPAGAPNAWGAAPAVAAARTPLAKILHEEEQRPKASKQAAAAAPPVRGATLGEFVERQLNPNPAPRSAAWGGAAAAPTKAAQLSMREIMMFEESAADLEGGDMDEDVSDYLPQQSIVQPARGGSGGAPWAGPQVPTKTLKEIQEEEARARQQQLQAQQAAAAPPPAAQDDDMLWDYAPSVAPAAPPPPPPPVSRPPGMPTAAAVAAKGVPATAAASGAGKGAWTNVAGPAAGVAKAPAAAVVGAGRPNGAAVVATARPAAAPARPTNAPSFAPPAPVFDADGASTLLFRDQPLSAEFHDWCKDQVKRLLNTDEMAMIEVLLSMDSRSEVAETCQLYMGNKPGVGAFVAEFLKRKDGEVLRQQQGSKKKKGGNTQTTTSAASVVKGAAVKGKGK